MGFLGKRGTSYIRIS